MSPPALSPEAIETLKKRAIEAKETAYCKLYNLSFYQVSPLDSLSSACSSPSLLTPQLRPLLLLPRRRMLPD